MLARHHIPATLYLGVARERRMGVLRAHAWVRAGQLEVTHAGYAPACNGTRQPQGQGNAMPCTRP